MGRRPTDISPKITYRWPLAHETMLNITLLQGIFLTQGSNLCLLCLLHWQAGSLNSDWIKCREEEERRYWMQCFIDRFPMEFNF